MSQKIKNRLFKPSGFFADHLIKSAASSALGFSCDFACLALLVEKLGFNYLVATALSFAVGTSCVFLLNQYWVFPGRRFQKGYTQYSVFLVFATVGAGLNVLIIWLITESLGLHYLVSKVISGLLVFGFNFATRKYFIFAGKKAELGPSRENEA